MRGFYLAVHQEVRARCDHQDAHDSLERQGRDVLEQIRPGRAADDGACAQVGRVIPDDEAASHVLERGHQRVEQIGEQRDGHRLLGRERGDEEQHGDHDDAPAHACGRVQRTHYRAQNQKTYPYPVQNALLFQDICLYSASYDDCRMFYYKCIQRRIRLVIRRFNYQEFIEKPREFIYIYRIFQVFPRAIRRAGFVPNS